MNDKIHPLTRLEVDHPPFTLVHAGSNFDRFQKPKLLTVERFNNHEQSVRSLDKRDTGHLVRN